MLSRVPYVVYKENDVWKGTSKQNYEAQIRDTRKVVTFYGLATSDEVLAYMEAYMGGIDGVEVIK